MCLSDTAQVRVPTSQSAKIILEEAGLGEKKITVPGDCSSEHFRELLLETYPKLAVGGGFELLRCLANSRDLEVIPMRIATNPHLLKRRVGNGRIYIRPIQRDLDLTSCETASDDELFMASNSVTILQYCLIPLYTCRLRRNVWIVIGWSL